MINVTVQGKYFTAISANRVEENRITVDFHKLHDLYKSQLPIFSAPHH